MDVWCKHHLRLVSFSWSNASNSQAFRLDRFLVSKSISDKVASCNIFPCGFSDHDFVDLDFTLDGAPRCRNETWKFNSSLLSDPDVKQLVTDEIEIRKLEINKFCSFGDWWDNLKVRIRKISIDYPVRKHRELNAERSSLTKQLIRAKNALHSGDVRVAPVVKNLESALSSLIYRGGRC